MTPEERAEARRWHSREPDGLCRDCHYTYPCHTIRALDALDAAEAKAREEYEHYLQSFDALSRRLDAAEADAEALYQALRQCMAVLSPPTDARAALAAHVERTRG